MSDVINRGAVELIRSLVPLGLMHIEELLEIWVHDPEAYLAGLPTHFYNSRGVAYWADGDDARIFFGINGAYLLALDACTGEPIRDFGDDGRVDLMEDIPRATRGETTDNGRNLVGVASPPERNASCGDVETDTSRAGATPLSRIARSARKRHPGG